MSDLLLTIAELLQLDLVHAFWVGTREITKEKLKGVSTDSRAIKSGELFFAIRGERFDGHDFVFDAQRRGAISAVVSRKWYEKNSSKAGDFPFVIVQDTLLAYQEFARYYLGKFDLAKIAVTGSSGKTTTKEAIFSVLSQKYNVLRNIKSYNNHIGVPATIYSLRPGHQILLTEMGANHIGELERLSYIVEPSVCLITNIGYAHLEYFKSLKGVLQAKMEIFSHAQEDAIAIYNYDDPILSIQTFPVPDKLSYGVKKGADVFGCILKCDELARYTFEFQGHQFNLKVPGRHNVSNALAAIAVGIHFDLNIKEMQTGLESFTSFDQRMEVLAINGLKVLNDSYNSNPDSCRAAFETIADIKISKGGRRIAVLGDMLELGSYSRTEHERLADHAARYQFDAIFLYGTETEFTAHKAKELGISYVRYFREKEDLQEELLRFVRANDLILVKGSRAMAMETVVQALKRIH